MSELIYKFLENLHIPDNIRDNLFKERNNEQLKVFALSVPDLQYPDTYILAGRLLIYVNIKVCPKLVVDYVDILKDVLNPDIADFLIKNFEKIDKVLEETYYENFSNQNILSASVNTLYLLRISADEPPVETPVMCKMRQAVQFYHKEGMDRVLKCFYELLDQLYVHASPTMFNAGLIKSQSSSCFLLTLGDSLDDLLYSGVGDAGVISKLQGGIGMNLNNVRHSSIGNAGKSGGIMPFGEIYDKNTKCVNQGSKRNGALTLFLNIWHIDIIPFMQARDNYTNNGVRFSSANTAVFISDLFMERVKENKKWTVFCPSKAKINGKKLSGTYGPEFEELYIKLEEEAPKRLEDFNLFVEEIKEIETKINSSKEINEEYIKEYHKKIQKRSKMRKNLIEYKVLDAFKLYELLCDMNVKSGQPYVAYRDATNIKNNMMNIGTTEGLNLCVAPETLILTDKGHYPIIELNNKKVNVWNGKEFSEVIVKKTGTGQELIRVEFDDESYLDCTKYHNFFIQDEYNDDKDIELKSEHVKKIEANNLEYDMKLVNCQYPLIDEGQELKDAYTNGIFAGKGTYLFKRLPTFFLKDKNSKILSHLNYKSVDKNGNYFLPLDLKERNFVPINYSLKSKLDWLAGLIDSKASIERYSFDKVVLISSLKKDFLLKVKYMLQTCGCNSKITREKNYHNDGHIISINFTSIQKLINHGFKCHRLEFLDEKLKESHGFVKVKNIIYTNRNSDTYCFTEPLRNAGIFNGIFAGNCMEITEPSSPDSIASCNLGHINLKRYVLKSEDLKSKDFSELRSKLNLKNVFDFKLLGEAMFSLVENINKVIDYNYYPLDERDKKDKTKVIKKGKISQTNLDNRPIGIGVSGLAETFALLKLPFVSDSAKHLNKMIFASMYYYGLKQSCQLAKIHGSYSSFKTGECKIFKEGEWKTFPGSLLSNGYFQFDLWQAEAEYLKSINRLDETIYNMDDNIPIEPSEWGGEGSWDELREEIMEYGSYNSMILAPMPTASTSQLLRNAECFEAHQTLIYSRKLVHGNFSVFSEPFVKDMQELGLWTNEMIFFIEMDNGSIRYIDHFIKDFYKDLRSNKSTETPDRRFLDKVKELQEVHKGMYEISQKETMQMSRQRGIYVDQSQSLNIYIPEPSKEKMMSVHAYSKALQLKTGMYYLRQNPASQTERFTVILEIKDYYNNLIKKLNAKVFKKKEIVCNDEVCIMCQ